MRIVHVCRQYAPALGGIEAVVENIARAQVAEGHDVRVVTLDRLFGVAAITLPPRDVLDGVEVVRLPFRGSERYPVAPGVLRQIKGADLVHVHGIDFFFDFLALTRPWHRRRMIATTHGGFFHTDYQARLKRLWFGAITKASAKAYKVLVACSAADHALFEPLGHPALTLVENGVDTGKFRGLSHPDAKSILYFGRLAPNKGLDRLLNWFAAVRAADPEWSLVIAGRPSGVTAASLRQNARALGVGHAVSVVESPDDFRLRRLIADASVFASASSYEGFGLAAIEAASAGLYPVLSAIPPFERTAARLPEGLITSFDPAPAEIARFLNGWRSRTPALRQQAIAAAAEEFGWPRALAGYASVYDALHPRVRNICGVEVSAPSRSDAIARIKSRLEAHDPFLVAFCNAHTVNVARRAEEMREQLASAFVLNDGIGVDLASRILFGSAFPTNLNGTDFTPALLAQVERPLRIYLLGGSDGVPQRAARELVRKFPHHSVVGLHHGYFEDRDSARVAGDVRATAPDLILVGMGQPRQEVWAGRHLRDVPAVVMCVGAYLDFLAGTVRRAPPIIRQVRMEWAFRLVQEPRRLASRYLIGNFVFLREVYAAQRRQVRIAKRIAAVSDEAAGSPPVGVWRVAEPALRIAS